MFATNAFIDSIQTYKKFYVSSFVTDEKIKKSLNSFVDAQTAFTKQVVKTFEEVSSQVYDETMKKFNESNESSKV
jgi:hypothetical protein